MLPPCEEDTGDWEDFWIDPNSWFSDLSDSSNFAEFSEFRSI